MDRSRAGIDRRAKFLATPERERAAWSVSTVGFAVGAKRSGNRSQPIGEGLQLGGGAIALTDQLGTWGGIDFLTADAMVGELVTEDREVWLKDTKDDRTPGILPWELFGEGKDIREALPLEGIVVRTAAVGKGFRREHVLFTNRARLIAHHRPDDPPIHSTPIHDPGTGAEDWVGHLHNVVRVRPWSSSLCSLDDDPRATATDFEEPVSLYSALLNFTKSEGDNSGWGGAHFARKDTVLSAETHGFAHPCDDGQHKLFSHEDGEVVEGGLHITRTKFGDARRGILYSPAEFVNAQWRNGGKGPFIRRVEWREDFNRMHDTHCGKPARGEKRWMTWSPFREYDPGSSKVPIDDPGAGKTPTDDPGGTKTPTDPGAQKLPPSMIKLPPPPTTATPEETEGGSDHGHPQPEGPDAPGIAGGETDWPDGGHSDGGPNYTAPLSPGGDAGEGTGGDAGGAGGGGGFGGAGGSGSVGGAFEGSDGGFGNESGRSPTTGETLADEQEAFWKSRYGYTEKRWNEEPLTGHGMWGAEYENATPHVGKYVRWSAVKRIQEKLDIDDDGWIIGREPGIGPGFKIYGSASTRLHEVYTSLNSIDDKVFDAFNFDIFAAAGTFEGSAGTMIHDGRFGIGSKIPNSTRIARGFELRLDASRLADAEEPDLYLSRKDAAADVAGAGQFYVEAPLGLEEVSSEPGTPSAGFGLVYTDSRGFPMFKDDNGLRLPLFGAHGMRLGTFIDSDYMETPVGSTPADGAFRVVPAGAGAGYVAATAIDKTAHPGIWGLSTGTSAAGRTFIISSSTNGFHLGVGGRVRVGTLIRTPSDLADATNDYTIRGGIFSISVPNIVNYGVGFEYDRTVAGGNWQGITVDAGQSTLDTGVGVDADTWYMLEAEINEDATEVEFFIDGVSVGTLSTAANIPDGTGFNHFYNAHIYKLAGTSARIMYIDASYLYMEVDR